MLNIIIIFNYNYNYNFVDQVTEEIKAVWTQCIERFNEANC